MQFAPFSENVTLNNVILVAIVTGVCLVVLAITVAITNWSLKRAATVSGVDELEAVVERVTRPVRVISIVSGLLIVLAGCTLLAVSVWRDLALQDWLNEGASYLTWQTLRLTVEVVGGSIGVVAGSLWLRRVLEPILLKIIDHMLKYEVFQGQDETVSRVILQIRPLINVTLIYIAWQLLSGLLSLPDGLRWLIATLIYVLLVINSGRTLVFIVHLVTDSLDRMGARRFEETRYDIYYKGVRNLWPLARRTFEAVVYISMATLVVQEFEALETFAPYGPLIIRIIGIFFLARVIVALSQVLVHESMVRSDAVDEALKRRLTLVYLVQSVVKYAIYFSAALLMMREVGIDPAPFLAGAGILGLTVGLGAQKLVNDMVNGFFILFEGQVLTGDFVRIGEAEGVVEGVYLRVTKLRDTSGRLHTIRNGNIETVVNFSKDWVFAVVEIGVAYEMNLNKVFRVLEEAGAQMQQDHPEEVLDPPLIQGVDQFADSAIVIRTVTRVRPGQHLIIQRLWRRCIKEAFDANDIEIPYPRQVEIHMDAQGRPAGDPDRLDRIS